MEPIHAPESIDLIALAPVLVLSVFAMSVLVLDLWAGKNKTLLMFVSLVGLLMTAISAFAKHPLPAFAFTDSYIVDHLSLFFICIFTLSSALAILLSIEYNEREGVKAGEYYSLILLCTVGMILLASSTDMIMIFLGVEIVSICLYVLAGIRRDNTASNEAALKYFLLGAFATGFLLYGMTLVYGSTGSTNLFKIAEFVKSDSAQSNPLAFRPNRRCRVRAFPFKSASGTVWVQGIWGALMHECSDDFAVVVRCCRCSNIALAWFMAA